mgnify:CR=1 FL=1
MLQQLGILGGLALTTALMLPGPTSAPAATLEEGAYAIDGGHSSVVFRTTHLGVANFYGRFNEVSGEIVFDPEAPEDSKVTVEIPVESVDTNSAKRDQHLRGPDFFSAREFPTATFTSSAAKVVERDPLVMEVTGELDLAGKKREVVARVEHTGSGKGMRGGELVGFEARLTIQRSEFGIDYMPDGLGEDVHLILAVEAKR